ISIPFIERGVGGSHIEQLLAKCLYPLNIRHTDPLELVTGDTVLVRQLVDGKICTYVLGTAGYFEFAWDVLQVGKGFNAGMLGRVDEKPHMPEFWIDTGCRFDTTPNHSDQLGTTCPGGRQGI